MATRNVDFGRKAYHRFAETAEAAVNALDRTAARAGASDAVSAAAARRRAEFRAIALQGQIATDTNVRAYFDCLEDMATASSVQGVVAVQASFVCDQWQRSLRQMLDLQRMTIDALRNRAA